MLCALVCARAGCQVCVNEFISTQRRFLSAFFFQKETIQVRKAFAYSIGSTIVRCDAMRFAIRF